jgi:exopolysaccharide biosynthesis polyprenyl glycosylphosphotransferase
MAVDVLDSCRANNEIPRRWNTGRAVALISLDVLIVPAAVAASVFVASADAWDGVAVNPLDRSSLVAAAVAPLFIAAGGGYRHLQGARRAYRRLGWLVLAAILTVWLGIVVGGIGAPSPDVGQCAAIAGLCALWWAVARIFLDRVGIRAHRVLIIGSGSVGAKFIELTRRHPEHRLEIVGYLDDDPAWTSQDAPPRLGQIEDLDEILKDGRVDRVVVSFSRRSDESILRVLQRCDIHGVEVDIVPRLFELVGSKSRNEALGGLPLITVLPHRFSLLQRALKRTADVILSAVMLVIAAPVMAAIALALLIQDGRPIFFRQLRLGRRGEPLRITKFRTMTRDAERVGLVRVKGLDTGDMSVGAASAAMKIRDDPRVTRVGAFLRRTSLDELPQLWDVLRGAMSLVGPRPLLLFEGEHLSDWQKRRLEVRPGITGLWQVLGRSEIGWDERMELDYKYVRNWSLTDDLGILARTPGVVIKRRGAV